VIFPFYSFDSASFSLAFSYFLAVYIRCVCFCCISVKVEIVPFCHEHTTRVVEALPSLKGCRAVLRRGNVSNNKADGTGIAITDNGNYIIDLYFDNCLQDITSAAKDLTNTVGVVEHGLFVNMASAIILANTSEVSIIDCHKKN
jgi:ribose 5-phosphate isomerase A